MISTKLERTESALFLKEMYVDTYLPIPDGPNKGHLNAIANPSSVEPIITERINMALDEYVCMEIKEYLGLSFNEYLDTPKLQRDRYIEYLSPMIEEKKRKLAELNATKEDIAGLSNEQ